MQKGTELVNQGESAVDVGKTKVREASELRHALPNGCGQMNTPASPATGSGDKGNDTNDDRKAIAVVTEYRLSPWRWPLLIGVCTFAFCNGFANEHSVILNVYANTLEMSLRDYVNLYQMFFFVPMVASFLAAGLIDRYGIKLVIYLTLLMAFVRNGSRMLLFLPALPGWRHLRFVYYIMQRALTQANYAFYYCYPLNLAENWFSESERSMALSLLLSAPFLGASGANLALPRLVFNLETSQWIVWFNIGTLAVSLVAVGVGVRRSTPAEGPPSERSQISCDRKKKVAASTPEAFSARAKLFLVELTRVLRSSNLVIQMIAMLTFDQLIHTLVLVIQDIFAGAGLSSVFTGQFATALTLSATLVQLLVARRLRPKRQQKQPEEARGVESKQQEDLVTTDTSSAKEPDPYNTRLCKVLLLAELITFFMFAMSLVLHEFAFLADHSEWIRRNQWILICICSFTFVVVKNCAAPYLNEQTAELISGLTSEANSSAWQSLFSAALFNSYTFVFVRLRQLKEPLVKAAAEVLEGLPNSLEGEEDALSGSTVTNSSLVLEGAESNFDYCDHNITTTTPTPTIGDNNITDKGMPLIDGKPLYLRPMLFACCVALTTTMIYLIKFDAMASKRRAQMRRLARLSSGLNVYEPPSLSPPPPYSGASNGAKANGALSEFVSVEMTRL